MKFKRILSFCLPVLFSVSLVACSNGNDTTNTDGTNAIANDASDNSEVSEEVIMYYDDYTIEIDGILSTADGLQISDNSVLEIATKQGKTYFHACGVGAVTVTCGDKSVDIVVDRARLNLIVVMGQSNSGNHFDNALSDITCPIGTAYWWGNDLGTQATEPVDFTHATKGFHSTLLAELYAQSVAAGEPVKNVLIWHEGGSSSGNGTSKNGSSIHGWAASHLNTDGTDYTVEMIENCVEYYSANKDKYVIESKGAYWLQGEGDGARGMSSTEYTMCFEAMWTKLKRLGGLDYMAIMRVRKGGDNNTFNNDIDYSTVVSAQFELANKHPEIFIATTITESFTGAPTDKKSIDISKYIRMNELYSKQATHTDSYGNDATYKDGVLTTTMKTLFGSNNKNHYGKFGYTLIASDAAYNMYHAINGTDFAFVSADSSGSPATQKTAKAGDTVTLNIKNVSADLAFRAAPGSVAGTLSVVVKSDSTNVTANVLNTSGVAYKCINTAKLKTYDNVTITVTYTTEEGESGSVTYNVDNAN